MAAPAACGVVEDRKGELTLYKIEPYFLTER
jgi:hypothetical protein